MYQVKNLNSRQSRGGWTGPPLASPFIAFTSLNMFSTVVDFLMESRRMRKASHAPRVNPRTLTTEPDRATGEMTNYVGRQNRSNRRMRVGSPSDSCVYKCGDSTTHSNRRLEPRNARVTRFCDYGIAVALLVPILSHQAAVVQR